MKNTCVCRNFFKGLAGFYLTTLLPRQIGERVKIILWVGVGFLSPPQPLPILWRGAKTPVKIVFTPFLHAMGKGGWGDRGLFYAIIESIRPKFLWLGRVLLVR